MYCVASLGETDTYWRYRCFTDANLVFMKEFIDSCVKNGCLVRVFKQIEVKEFMK